MNEQPGTGGSYIVQPDGSLKLVSQTAPAKEREPEVEAVAEAPAAAGARKKDA